MGRADHSHRVQAAVTAGLRFAQGDAVVVLDADLQEPPELIPAMVEKLREGYHVVYAQRTAPAARRSREEAFRLSLLPCPAATDEGGHRQTREIFV